MGPIEKRLLSLERATLRLPTWLGELEQRATALEQSLTKAWGIDDSNCTVAVSGTTVSACATSVAVGSVTIDFTAQPSGMAAGSMTSDGSGNFSGSVSMLKSDTSIDYSASGSGRFGTATGFFAAACGDTVNLGSLQIPGASGYQCVPWCSTPAKLPFLASDTFFGTFTNLYTTASYPGVGSCPAVSPVHVRVRLAGSLSSPAVYIDYETAGSPWPAGCPYASSGTFVDSVAIPTSPSATSCPPGLSMTFTWTNAVWAASGTLTLQESP